MLLPDIEMEPSGRPQGKIYHSWILLRIYKKTGPSDVEFDYFDTDIFMAIFLFTDYLSGVVREPAGKADRMLMCSYLRNQ